MTARNRRRALNVALAVLFMCGGGLRHASADGNTQGKTRIATACVMVRDANGVPQQTCQ